MLEILKSKLKINWWENIPLIGNIIFSIRFEFLLNKQEKIIRKNVKFYKGIANLIAIIISISFLIPFFILRNKNGYGAWPSFFWIGLGFGIANNITPYWSRFLYIKGINKWQNEAMDKS